MVEIYRALRAFLLADATIATAVGSTRIYPHKLPQAAATPAIVMTIVDEVRSDVLKGRASRATPRYQIDCWVRETSGTSSYETALTLGGAVLARLEGYVGVMVDQSTSPETMYFTQVEFIRQRPDFESDVTGGYWRHFSEYYISHGVHPVTA